MPYLVQDQGGLAYFGRPGFSCPATTKPYLVRAVFINGGTWRTPVSWTHNAELVVSHGSLGPGGPASKSALDCASAQRTQSCLRFHYRCAVRHNYSFQRTLIRYAASHR